MINHSSDFANLKITDSKHQTTTVSNGPFPTLIRWIPVVCLSNYHYSDILGNYNPKVITKYFHICFIVHKLWSKFKKRTLRTPRPTRRKFSPKKGVTVLTFSCESMVFLIRLLTFCCCVARTALKCVSLLA